MLSQIRWHQANAENNLFEYLNFVRKVVHWWNGRQMDKHIGNELDNRFNEHKADPDNTRTKSIIDLVLQAYLPTSTSTTSASESAERISDLKPKSAERLEPAFRAFATAQIRLFIFVGHDSSSSTICYLFHLLSLHPASLSRLRTELDENLGLNVAEGPELIKSQPHLMNNLPYTTACIKETLRLFPPGGCSRSGHPEAVLISDSGKPCPTENTTAVFTVHTELQRSPAYWIRGDEFVPERWLPEGEAQGLAPLKGGYRAFEIGPRNCLAQGLVMTELRVIAAIVLRRFDFQPGYEEVDKDRRDNGKIRRYRGERAYQIEEGAAHPCEHYPCRVKIRQV